MIKIRYLCWARAVFAACGVAGKTSPMVAINADAPEVLELSPVERLNYLVVEPAKVWVKRLLHAKELTLVFDRLDALSRAKIVLISTMRNEAFRMPYFLDYYRRLGVEHFIFIDNESTDTLHDLVRDAPDVSLYVAHGSYKDARYGIVWVNHLLSKYAVGKWVLHVDPDEFLVYPECDQVGLRDLTRRLEETDVNAFPTVMVDMYSPRPIEENVCRPGQNPLEVCSYFDADTYVESVENPLSVKHIRGGPRARVFFSDSASSPMLNKTPLVHWKPHYAFVRSTMEIWPPNLADSKFRMRKGMGGALLHFKFLSEFTEKVDEEATRGSHTDEYKQYRNVLNGDAAMKFITTTSMKFESWRTLVDCGLIF